MITPINLLFVLLFIITSYIIIIREHDKVLIISNFMIHFVIWGFLMVFLSSIVAVYNSEEKMFAKTKLYGLNASFLNEKQANLSGAFTFVVGSYDEEEFYSYSYMVETDYGYKVETKKETEADFHFNFDSKENELKKYRKVVKENDFLTWFLGVEKGEYINFVTTSDIYVFSIPEDSYQEVYNVTLEREE